MDWQVWRLLSSDRLQVSLDELVNRWSIDDVLDAHLTLDLIEDSHTVAGYER